MLLLWLLLAGVLGYYSPKLDNVTTVGPGFALPEGYDSRAADDLLAEGFGPEKSRLLVLIGAATPLTESDHQLIQKELEYIGSRKEHLLVGYVISPYTHPYLAKRLTSLDNSTVMCAVVLRSQFVSFDTHWYIDDVVAHLKTFTAKYPRLSYEITDSAAIGRDYNMAAGTSLERTRFATILLVVTILLVLYRSPVTPIIPLSVIALSLWVSNCVMALLGRAGMDIPKLVPIYMVVILFGSCTDYCLFLIGRFREELARGHSRFEAARIAVTHVGEAVAASAGTTIAGLCMMAFADFAIFRSTGPALGIGLAVGLLCALTFAPALMVIPGKWLFWPMKLRLVDAGQTRSGRLWGRFAGLVVKRPGLVIVVALLFFGPLAIHGGSMEPSYDLFSELPEDAPSVRGNNLVVEKFAETSRSEQLVLVMKSSVNFKSHRGLQLADKVSKAVEALPDVIEVRSITRPMGKVEPVIDEYIREPTPSVLIRLKAETVLRIAFPRYVSPEGIITRVNVLLKHDTFSPEAIRMGHVLWPTVARTLKGSGVDDVEFHFGGTSAHMDDIRRITRGDLRRLRWMVLGVLYVILTVVLRGGIAPVYLLGTMVINYFTALGVTQIVFAVHRHGLAAFSKAVRLGDVWGSVVRVHELLATAVLDWKVEFFLFVLLVAIGVDYNIYIMSRLREERKRQLFRPALRNAIVFTGSIISSCGIIMAGTFGSMTRSTLSVMVQIGTAMAVGVLLDTFVVRPLIVPALAMLVEKVKEKFRGSYEPV